MVVKRLLLSLVQKSVLPISHSKVSGISLVQVKLHPSTILQSISRSLSPRAHFRSMSGPGNDRILRWLRPSNLARVIGSIANEPFSSLDPGRAHVYNCVNLLPMMNSWRPKERVKNKDTVAGVSIAKVRTKGLVEFPIDSIIST